MAPEVIMLQLTNKMQQEEYDGKTIQLIWSILQTGSRIFGNCIWLLPLSDFVYLFVGIVWDYCGSVVAPASEREKE